jgi:hypothetical protein
MGKYRAKIQVITYADFEFDADSDGLAQDHVEKLMEDYNQDPSTGYSPQNFLEFYCSNLTRKIQYSKIQTQDWKDM